jgi:hypothetical protein
MITVHAVSYGLSLPEQPPIVFENDPEVTARALAAVL